MSLAENVLSADEEQVAEIPVEHREQFGSNRIGSVVVSEDRVLFFYLSDGSWTQFAEYELSSKPFAQHRDRELYSVFLPAPDGKHVSKLKSEFISEVEHETGLSYFMDVLEANGREPAVNPTECDCSRISSNGVLVEDENMELSEYFDEHEFRFVSCKECFKIYGRYREGKKASLNKLFSADWLLGGDLDVNSIIEVGQQDIFAIHHPPNGSIRTQDAVLTLSHIGNRSSEIISTYKHEYQHAFCYIQHGEMVGYLSWEEHDRGAIQSQLYIREKYRGNGLASTLVSDWYKTVCDSDQYFADELTDGGRAVLDSIGHLDLDSGPAREVYSLTPMAFG